MQFSRLVSPRLRRIALTLVALYLLYLALSLVLVPRALRWGVETALGDMLGRSVQVEDVAFNPLRLSAALRDLRIEAAAAGELPLLRVRALDANLSLASLWHRAPVLDALRIDGLALNLERLDAQRLNFSDILDRLAARPKTDDGPARFALFNLQVTDGRVDFDDRPRGQKHALEEIGLSLPFLSNLPADLEIEVQPAFAARLNGTPLALTGEMRPFADSLESVLRLKLDGLPLSQYLSLAPVELNFELASARLDTDLTVAFRRAQGGAPASVVISGSGTVHDLKLAAPAGAAAAPLLQWQSLRVEIAAFAPLERRLELAAVQLQAPQAWVERDAGGAINWSAFLAHAVDSAPNSAAAPAAAPAAPYGVQIAALSVANGQVHFLDRAVDDLRIEASELTLEASELSTTNATPGRVKLTGAGPLGERFGLDGQLALAPLAANFDFSVDDTRLRLFARYIAQVVNATLDGRSSVRGKLAFAQSATGVDLQLTEVGIDGQDLRLRGPDGAGAALDLPRLTVTGGRLDFTRRQLGAEQVLLQGPRLTAKRLASGEIGWMQLRAAAAPPDPTAAAAAPSWGAEIAEFAVKGGRIQFEDAAVEPTAQLGLEALDLSVAPLRADGAQPAELRLRTRLAGGGSLAVDGGLRWDAPAGKLRVDLRAADLTRLQPYLAQHLNAGLASAHLSSVGELSLAGESAPLTYRGTLRLADLHLTDRTNGEDLLKWQALDVDRVALTLGSPPSVEVGTLTLADFYARVIISAQGRLNLVDLFAAGAAQERPGAPAAEAPAAPPTLRIEGIELARGNLNFTDNFIRPNYTANLTNIGGNVGRLASDGPEPAPLALTGSVDGEAPVKIEGRLNPLAPKLFLDLTGSTKGVDLPRFTPYSAHYAGYPILKGKLTMEVSYKIEDRRLDASNHLFIDQLTLGERIDSPNATQLPVPLAVALLKNARGEIDLRLPVTGSLDDPQFSIGAVVVQVLVNLLTKAVTAPFTLLAATFGPGEELGYVQFGPGSAALDAKQREKLDKLGRALADRPALKMDLIGRAEPGADAEGLRTAALEAKLRAAKARQLARAGGASAPAGPAEGEPLKDAPPKIEPQERAALLAAVYGDESIPDKPRNLIGLAKSLPAAEMEQRLLAYLAPTADDLRRLANQRAAAVRDDLEQRGGIDRARLFLVEPKLDAKDLPADTVATRVDFALK